MKGLQTSVTHIDLLEFLASFDIRSMELVNITKYLAIGSAAAGGSIIQENDSDRLTSNYKYVCLIIIINTC